MCTSEHYLCQGSPLLLDDVKRMYGSASWVICNRFFEYTEREVFP